MSNANISDCAEAVRKARVAVRNAEDRNMSKSTLERRYKVFFAAEDAYKRVVGW